MQKPRAVVLLSGGVDSTTACAIARAEGFALHALTIDYGQRHRLELEAARRVAASLGVVEHVTMPIDLRRFGGSALTADIAVPKGRTVEEIGRGIPVTYVPARNTIFLSFALAWAEVLGSSDIFVGVNVLDYSVSGDSRVWIRGQSGARLMPIHEFCALPEDRYDTVAVDRETLMLQWRPVTRRWRHRIQGKRCFRIYLERGRDITITEDHSLFTIDPGTARIVPVRGEAIVKGTPIVVPFDLSSVVTAWSRDLSVVDVSRLVDQRTTDRVRRSIQIRDDVITNRLGKINVPKMFPLTDDFLYIVGLWLAEGGKALDSATSTLAFSVGGIPGAVETLRRYFHDFGVTIRKSPENEFDYMIHSSVFCALFKYFGTFGTAKAGQKKFPWFFWDLSQRQRRFVIAGLWDGDGSHVFSGEAALYQKSHALINDAADCLLLDGIFARVRKARHGQRGLVISRVADYRKFATLYPLRHPSKRSDDVDQATINGRDKATGLWKCAGLWGAVSAADLAPGMKTRVYNRGGQYDSSVRSQRAAFDCVPALGTLVASKLAFCVVRHIEEVQVDTMYDLSVEGAENFVANGILAHNSGYPDCRPEYIEAFSRMADLATKAGVEGRQKLVVHTPLIRLTKAEIIRKGIELGVDYGLTLSCYEPSPAGEACGACDACLLRLKAFWDNGLRDPVRYRQVPAR